MTKEKEERRIMNLLERFSAKRKGSTSGIIEGLGILAASMHLWTAVDYAVTCLIQAGLSETAQKVADCRPEEKRGLSQKERLSLVEHARSVQDAYKMALSLGVIAEASGYLVTRAITSGNLDIAQKTVKHRREYPVLNAEEKTWLVENLLPKEGQGGTMFDTCPKIARELNLLPPYRKVIVTEAIRRHSIEPVLQATLRDPNDPGQGTDLSDAELEALLSGMKTYCDNWPDH